MAYWNAHKRKVTSCHRRPKQTQAINWKRNSTLTLWSKITRIFRKFEKLCYAWAVFRFHLSQRNCKHKSKHKKKEKVWSICLSLRLCYCLRQGHFHGEVRIVVLASPVKTRLCRQVFVKQFKKYLLFGPSLDSYVRTISYLWHLKLD